MDQIEKKSNDELNILQTKCNDDPENIVYPEIKYIYL